MVKILIVDDEKSIRSVLGEMLELNGYKCSLAASATEAREILEKENFNLVLSDINMPEESGLDFVRNALIEYPDVAAIMVTAMGDPMIADVALKIGVYDYITKPFELNAVLISVANALKRRNLEIDNRSYQKTLENMVAIQTAALQESETRLRAIFEAAEHVSFIMIDQVDDKGSIIEFSRGAERILGYNRKAVMGQSATILQLPDDILKPSGIHGKTVNPDRGFSRELVMTKSSGEELPALSTIYPMLDSSGSLVATLVVSIDVSDRIKAEKKTQASMEQLQKALEGSIHAMALAVEMRDPYTSGHQQRVADLARAIAKKMGMSEEKIAGVLMAGIIHDLGKIAIPAEILSKPGVITKTEFELIKSHVRVGYDILKNIEFPWPIADIVLQHHERLDGSGYPTGLSGSQILLEARILSVADVTEAMASHRPYRPSLGIDVALEEIEKNKGVLYDSDVVTACLKVFHEGGYKFRQGYK
jgi:PAS domain S-box-containing protein/putative nucleotidyltransferase with HDIG domain